MENNIREVKDAIYTGMSVFATLKDFIIESNGQVVSLEDKKYISLYLGVLYSDNDISKTLVDKKNTIYKKVKYRNLSKEELLKTYEENFVDILTKIDFTSLSNYFYFLLENELVYSANKNYRIKNNISNKVYAKK